MTAGDALPRPPTARERDVLEALLGHADFEGRDDLLAQLPGARVTGRCGCGCASVALAVDPGAPRADRSPSPIPNEAGVRDAAGAPLGGVILHIDDGRLSFLEVYSNDEPVREFPARDRLELWTPGYPQGRPRPHA